MKLSPPISPPTSPPLSAPPPYVWVFSPIRKGTVFLYSKLVEGSARLRAQLCKNNNNNISEAPPGLRNVFSLSSSSVIVLVQPSSDRFNTGFLLYHYPLSAAVFQGTQCPRSKVSHWPSFCCTMPSMASSAGKRKRYRDGRWRNPGQSAERTRR